MKNNKMLKTGKIVTKILEIFHWVGAAILAVAAVCSLALPSFVKYCVGITPIEGYGAPVEVYGFEMVLPVENGTANMTALFLFGIGGVLLLGLMAMIFRNLHLIMKNAETGTPFQKDNIRMMREIGIFSIAGPVVGLIMSIITRLVMGVDAVEISVNLEGFCMGIIVLCLTQFFVHGAQLEEDVEGLL